MQPALRSREGSRDLGELSTMCWSAGMASGRLAHMFDSAGAGVAGLLARAQTLIGEAVAAISSQLSGPAAAEALSAAVEVESQATLAATLLTERVDRSGEFASDGSVSMAAWLREQAHC